MDGNLQKSEFHYEMKSDSYQSMPSAPFVKQRHFPNVPTASRSALAVEQALINELFKAPWTWLSIFPRTTLTAVEDANSINFFPLSPAGSAALDPPWSSAGMPLKGGSVRTWQQLGVHATDAVLVEGGDEVLELRVRRAADLVVQVLEELLVGRVELDAGRQVLPVRQRLEHAALQRVARATSEMPRKTSLACR
eukprot:SM000073S21421  [mRNA]  locus=s73:153060:156754:- [translate_table: standard]